MSRVIVIGADGFVGSHLLRHLEGRGCEVIGTSRLQKEGFEQVNLRDISGLESLIERIRPDCVYNCSGSYSNDFAVDLNSNVSYVYNLLEAVRRIAGARCRTLLIGSSAEYGLPKDGNSLYEEHPLRPVSSYGLAKYMQWNLMRHYTENYNLDIVYARIFNLEGAGISHNLLPGRVQQLIKKYLAGEINHIELGDLNARRDYINVKDAAEWLSCIMSAGRRGETYNVGSGESMPVREIVRKHLQEAGLNMDVVKINSEFCSRSKDVSDIKADISKLKGLLERG